MLGIPEASLLLRVDTLNFPTLSLQGRENIFMLISDTDNLKKTPNFKMVKQHKSLFSHSKFFCNFR